MDRTNSNKGFRFFGILTVVAVYFLILVGGIVRSTGSGMGCPDWPKCFGNFVPPTSVEDLPADYKEIYANKRLNKNKRLAGLLNSIGFEDLSIRLLNDPALYVEADFNPLKTWIEYINRLIGVLIGLFIIGFVILSASYRKQDPPIFILGIVSLLLVLFEGWLGSLVVSTNLLPFMVSLHMGLALLLVYVLIYAVNRSQGYKITWPSSISTSIFKVIVLTLLFSTFFQIILGTQVREEIDIIASSLPNARNLWVDELGILFKVHRSFSILLILLHVFLSYKLFKEPSIDQRVKSLSLILLTIVLISTLTGVILNYMGMPAFIQPMHLLLASVLSGGQFLIYLMVVNSRKEYLHV